jgi:hypothetical protein
LSVPNASASPAAQTLGVATTAVPPAAAGGADGAAAAIIAAAVEDAAPENDDAADAAAPDEEIAEDGAAADEAIADNEPAPAVLAGGVVPAVAGAGAVQNTIVANPMFAAGEAGDAQDPVSSFVGDSLDPAIDPEAGEPDTIIPGLLQADSNLNGVTAVDGGAPAPGDSSNWGNGEFWQ